MASSAEADRGAARVNTPSRPRVARSGVAASADRVLAIAWATLLETARRRVVIVLVVLSVLAILLTGWGFSQLYRLAPASQQATPVDIQLVSAPLLILVLFMFSFVFALVAVFVAAPAVAGDLESGVALALLARPLRRWELLLGRWLGLAVLTTLYVTGATALELLVTGAATAFWPPDPAGAIGYLVGQSVAVLTVVIALSTRLSSVTAGIAGLLLFGTSWVAGVIGGIGAAFHDQPVNSVGAVASLLLPSDGLWRGAIYAVEPPQIILGLFVAGPNAAAFPFFVSQPPAGAYVAWSVAWILAVLALAAISLERREL